MNASIGKLHLLFTAIIMILMTNALTSLVTASSNTTTSSNPQLHSSSQPFVNPLNCPPLEQPSGPTVTVATEADLRCQAYNAAPGTTIWIEAVLTNGIYVFELNVPLIVR
jgi:hypothetical protein